MAAWPQAAKLDVLSIKETDYGFVQTSRWQHLDREHEEYVDIDADTAIPTDVKVLLLPLHSHIHTHRQTHMHTHTHSLSLSLSLSLSQFLSFSYLLSPRSF